MFRYNSPNKPSQREFYSLNNTHKIPCLGRYKHTGVYRLKLDFEKHTKVESGYLLIPQPQDGLKEYIDIYDRFCGVIYMLVKVGGDPDRFIISKEANDTVHIRAALSEFVGIEEYIKEIYPNLPKVDYRIYKSSNPIFHIIKLLRNYNIHLTNSTLKQKPMMVKTLIDESQEFEIQVEYISNLSVSELRRLSSAKDYSDTQLQKMVECFNNEQHEFGVTTLIIKAALEYSEQIKKLLILHECKPNYG
tara:strand:+ start:281 stop:1021 length:741 start_codon:yes stop_codon:yes gene_type:complete